MLIVGGIGIVLLVVVALRASWRDVTKRQLTFLGFAVVLPVLLVLVAGYLGHMRLLGRHLTPLLPFLLAFLAIGVHRLAVAGGWARGTAIAILIILLISAVQIRFAPRHQRDDYRSAAALARQALQHGETVWWAADPSTAAYYNVPLTSQRLILSSSLAKSSSLMGKLPDLVCLSKPDIYDSDGKIAHYLRDNGFTAIRKFQAFRIFARAVDLRQPP